MVQQRRARLRCSLLEGADEIDAAGLPARVKDSIGRHVVAPQENRKVDVVVMTTNWRRGVKGMEGGCSCVSTCGKYIEPRESRFSRIGLQG